MMPPKQNNASLVQSVSLGLVVSTLTFVSYSFRFEVKLKAKEKEFYFLRDVQNTPDKKPVIWQSVGLQEKLWLLSQNPHWVSQPSECSSVQ